MDHLLHRGTPVSARQEMMARRSRLGALIDQVGKTLGSPAVFLSFLGAHVVWVAANLGILRGVPVWDAPPFMLLATIDSALAPFLTLLILMRQERDGRTDELRQEVNLRLALRNTWQASAALKMLDDLQRSLKVESQVSREDLDELERVLGSRELLEAIRAHLDRTEGPVTGEEPPAGEKPG